MPGFTAKAFVTGALGAMVALILEPLLMRTLGNIGVRAA